MLARLQAGLVVAWVLGLACALRWAWQQPAALGCTLAVLGAALLWHAAWLALTFGVTLWRNRLDPRTPPIHWADVLTAWWGEVLASPRVFGWDQPFRAGVEPDRMDNVGGQTGVVLVHGFVCNRGLWNPWLRRFRRRGVPAAAVNLEPVFGSIDDYGTIIEAAVARMSQATGRPVLIVAHSMGGLAVRAWLSRLDNAAAARVAQVVTIASPHHGTWLAHFGLTDNARQMRPQGPWLQALEQHEQGSAAVAFVCCFGHCDNIVMPALTAVLPGAQALHVPAVGHVDMVNSPLVQAEVFRVLAECQVAGDGAQ